MKAKMGLRIIYGKSGSGKSEYCFSEISKIIEEDGKLEAECHFCHKKYNFSLEELKEIERGAK